MRLTYIDSNLHVIRIEAQGGIVFKENLNLKEIEIKVRKVLNYHIPEIIYLDQAHSETIDFFNTKPGLVLADQISGLLEFVEKIMALTVIPTFISSLKKIEQAEELGEADDITLNDILRPDIAAIRYPDNSEKKTRIIDRTYDIDPLWIVSLVTFSIHAYLEVYSSSILKCVSYNKEMVEDIETYLATIAEKNKDSSRKPILKVSDLKRASMKRRFRIFEQGVSMNAILTDIVGEEDYTVYVKAFEKYVDIRGKIAHSSPRLAPNEYTISDFDFDIGEFDERVLPKKVKKTQRFKEGITEFAKGMFDAMKVQEKIRGVVQMALIYPALLDSVLSSMIKCEEY